jgi:hypothetical protein
MIGGCVAHSRLPPPVSATFRIQHGDCCSHSTASAYIGFYTNPRTLSLSGGLWCRFDREEMNRKVYALGQEESNCGPQPISCSRRYFVHVPFFYLISCWPEHTVCKTHFNRGYLWTFFKIEPKCNGWCLV